MIFKKKKNSETEWLLCMIIALLLLMLIGLGIIFFMQQVDSDTPVTNDPDPQATLDMPSLSSYAPPMMIYRIDNVVYRMNMDNLESEEIAVVHGIAPDDWETLRSLHISPQLNNLYFTLGFSSVDRVRYKQDVATGQVTEIATYYQPEMSNVFSEHGHSLLYFYGDTHDILQEGAQTDEFVMFDDWYVRELAWAVNGSHVMLNVQKDNGDTHFVYREINPSRVIQPSPNYDIVATIAKDFRAYQIALSPDNVNIAMTGSTTTSEERIGLWVLERGKQEQPTSLFPNVDFMNHFSWSPDSEWLVYEAFFPNENNTTIQHDIMVANIETGELRNLTTTKNSNENFPNWLPNGDIVFKANDHMWRVDLEGDIERLPNTENAVYMGYRFGY